MNPRKRVLDPPSKDDIFDAILFPDWQNSLAFWESCAEAGLNFSSVVNDEGYTLLEMLCRVDPLNVQVIETILKHGWGNAKRATLKDGKWMQSPLYLIGKTATIVGLQESHKKAMDVLKLYGADWNQLADGKYHLFAWVCGVFSPQIIAYILSDNEITGTTVNMMSDLGNNWKMTPLGLLASTRFDYEHGPQIARMLLDAKADPYVVAGFGPQGAHTSWSILQLATYHANAALLEFFIPIMDPSCNDASPLTQYQWTLHCNRLSGRTMGDHCDHLKTWLLTEPLGNRPGSDWIFGTQEESLECFWSRLRLFGANTGFSYGPNSAKEDQEKWRWIIRESQGRATGALSDGTHLHHVASVNSMVGLRALTAPDIMMNPFLRDSYRKTARQCAASNEVRQFLAAYEEWKPIRACQSWWGPMFLKRSFALVRVMQRMRICADMRKCVIYWLAKAHPV